jgi:hypothetical protein
MICGSFEGVTGTLVDQVVLIGTGGDEVLLLLLGCG